MTSEKTQMRKRRSPAGDDSKKIVSLTIAPALVARIDEYAADKKISRSAAIENAIVNWLAPPPASPVATASEPVNSLIQPDDCLFASPQAGHAILYR
jgi:hypothetical protein